MKKLLKIFFITFCVSSFQIYAETVNPLDILTFHSKDLKQLKDTSSNSKIVNKKIKNIFKDYKIEQYENTDLFVISYDNKELVTSHLLPFLFNGNTVEIKDNNKPQRLLFKTSDKEFNRNILRLFNSENMVIYETSQKEKKGNIYVFFDFSCPYCQKFHETSLKYLNESGYTVSYLPFFKNPENYGVNNYLFNIFCLDDNQQKKEFINRAIIEDYDQNIKICNKKEYMKKVFQLADHLNIKGTPTLIFENGNKIEGYVPLQQLLPEISVNYN